MLTNDLGILIRLYGIGKKYKKKPVSIYSICKEIGIPDSGQNMRKIKSWIEAKVLLTDDNTDGYRIDCNRIWEMLSKNDREVLIEIISDRNIVL